MGYASRPVDLSWPLTIATDGGGEIAGAFKNSFSERPPGLRIWLILLSFVGPNAFGPLTKGVDAQDVKNQHNAGDDRGAPAIPRAGTA
jgi:hypothetical protein